MNKIFLFLFTLCLVYYQVEGAKNVESREDQESCPSSFTNDDNVKGVSDCVDRDLSNGDTYYDKCCYVRGMRNGRIGEGCLGLPRDATMDVPGTIKLYEENYFKNRGMQLKVYSVDCKASYIKLFFLMIILFILFI